LISIFNIWLPWFNFIDFSTFLQFFFLYSLYSIFATNNLYYVLFYVILQIFFYGFFLSLYQLEIFTAFLWLTEVVIVLVCLFLLFNTNPSGNVNKILKNSNSNQFSLIIVLVFIVCINFTFFMLPEYSIKNFLLSSYLWEDYYEALNNQNNNDLYGIFLSFYVLNSI